MRHQTPPPCGALWRCRHICLSRPPSPSRPGSRQSYDTHYHFEKQERCEHNGRSNPTPELECAGSLRMFPVISSTTEILNILQLYASVLALAAVSACRKVANIANTHLVWVLFGTWIVFAYRNIYPLGTFTLEPLDLHEGWCLWAKLPVLTFAAVVIPSFVPTQYVPFDPKVRLVLLRSYRAPNRSPHHAEPSYGYQS